MQASRALCLIVLSLGLTAAGAAGAQTPSLVVDVATGKVLHAEKATDPWFPASVTKLMTAYVALREVREGRSRLDEVLTLSENAVAMPPSKMGFKAGTELTLDNALKIIMVKSANDVSVAIAEGLGGSVEGFADMMNAQAQRLGMRESRFVNPHGLPDERQQTSARDMAILARALMLEFPEHDSLFKIDSIRFGKRVMRNHNGLMGRYPGADGMKTGFICASGFNVVASASQNGRRLITVVFGSRNGNERTLKAAELFDRGFAASAGMFAPMLASLPSSPAAAPFNMRPVICERGGAMPGEDDSPTGDNLTAAASVPSLTAPGAAMAFAGTGVPAFQKTVLGPRAPLNPIPVWIGRTPPAVEEPKVVERPRPAREPRPAVAAAGEPAVAANPPAPRRPAPKAQQAAVETKPKPAAAKPVAPRPVAASPAPRKPDAKPAAAKPEPKPEPKRAEAKPAVAKPEAKPAAAKPASKPAAKPAAKSAGKPKADD